MKLSIIIPVFNEEKTLQELIKRVNSSNIGDIQKEIIIIDDFSTDSTRNILKKLEEKYKIFYNDKNKGKGASVVLGLKEASGDILLIQDADLEYDPKDYYKLIMPIIKGESKVVYGSRLLKPQFKERDLHYTGNKILSFITSILYFRKITDMETCYKVFTKEVINEINLKSKRFDFEPEITSKILKKRYKIIEVPIRFKPRTFEEGKKISWKDGIKALYYLIKYRLVD